MAAAQAGDRAALNELLTRHYDRIYGLCRRLTGNDADALDAAQEALLSVVRGLPRFGGEASFRTWTYRIATNACWDELRRRRRRAMPGLPDDLAARPGTADESQAVTERLDLETALAGLAPRARAAVVLRDWCGLSYEEVADVLDIPVGTVRSRLARGRAALADQLSGGSPPDDPIGGTAPGTANPSSVVQHRKS